MCKFNVLFSFLGVHARRRLSAVRHALNGSTLSFQNMTGCVRRPEARPGCSLGRSRPVELAAQEGNRAEPQFCT